jgi:hypothetical protein
MSAHVIKHDWRRRYPGGMQQPPDGPGYWDPVPHIAAVFDSLPARQLRPAPEYVFCGKWEERNWRNVPGPFYGGMTDTCWVGRQNAPRHILYCDDDEFGGEFLYRQPHTVDELRAVLAGMRDDPWSGWACDGDSQWTPDLVRNWWRDRGRLREWILRKRKEWGSEGRPTDEHEGAGLTDYLAYLDSEVAGDLRCYMYFLESGRGPVRDERLPAL